jgi:hypothetical protein
VEENLNMAPDDGTPELSILARLEALEDAVILFIGNATADWSPDDVAGFEQDLEDPARPAPPSIGRPGASPIEAQERQAARERLMGLIWDQRSGMLEQR